MHVFARKREQSFYLHGPGIDEPLAISRSGAGGGTSVFHADGLGSITTLTNLNGNPVRSYTYDSFGRLVAQTGTFTNSYTYTGRELDPESGLFYYRARYYDPVAGRFIQEDLAGIPGSPNEYLYVTNDPLNVQDPLGLNPLARVAHRGFVLALQRMKDASVKSTIRSLQKRIARHENALKDPAQILVVKHHEHELRVFREQLKLAQQEAAGRGLLGAGLVGAGSTDLFTAILEEIGAFLDPFALIKGELASDEELLDPALGVCRP